MTKWKDIKGYEGLYQVSNSGEIKSFKRVPEKILKLSNDKDGYLQVQLCKNGKKKTYRVHALVAGAFIDNPYNKTEINHKDYNVKNNNVDNLEYVSHIENIKHSIINRPIGKTGERNISYIKEKNKPYHLAIVRNKKRIDRYYYTLTEAVEERNRLIGG
jgi:hypothetical protein